MKILITREALDPWREVATYQSDCTDLKKRFGATTVFVGTMREFNESDAVEAMTLEYYPGMTERELESIGREASQRWDILDLLVIHRAGEVRPNDPIVLVAVWSAHRAAAYEANRFVMEFLKNRAPFWKKERLRDDRTRWVSQNTRG